MTIAIYNKGGHLMKTTNLEKKEGKLGKLDVLWKREFDGTRVDAETILDKKMQKILNHGIIDEDEELLMYYWHNNDTGQYFISIYETLPKYIKGNWKGITKKEYERIFC